jgi:hypothetical protein
VNARTQTRKYRWILESWIWKIADFVVQAGKLQKKHGTNRAIAAELAGPREKSLRRGNSAMNPSVSASLSPKVLQVGLPQPACSGPVLALVVDICDRSDFKILPDARRPGGNLFVEKQ